LTGGREPETGGGTAPEAGGDTAPANITRSRDDVRPADGTRSARRPALRWRVGAALVVAAGAAAWALILELRMPGAWRDFDPLWLAGRALVHGGNPYDAVATSGWPWPLYHPLPAVLLDLPFTLLSRQAARIAFTACSAAFLTFAATRTAWWPLMFAVLAPFRHAVAMSQLSPVMTAAALMPAAGGLLIIKPNIGLALFASRPSKAAVVGGAILIAISLVVWPAWPVRWWHAARQLTHLPPVIRPWGALMLLALLRARHPEGRLLAALAVIPHRPVLYDMLPVLMLVPRTWKEMAVLGVGCELAYRVILNVPTNLMIDTFDALCWPAILAFVYIPALIIVLLRPRAGAARGSSLKRA